MNDLTPIAPQGTMRSMATYSFANCILEDAPYLTYFASHSSSVMNMRTEGILKILCGESLALHPDDKAALFASSLWKDFVGRCYEGFHHRLPTFDRFPALTLAADDAFFWSPFADTLCSFTSARCEDGSPYPFLADPINVFFPHQGRTDLAHCARQWEQLAESLSHVKRKGLVLYLPDTIRPPAFTPKHAAELKAHVTEYNKRAVEILEPRGWKVFAPSHAHCPPDAEWSHYSPEVVAEVQAAVAAFIGAGDGAAVR